MMKHWFVIIKDGMKVECYFEKCSQSRIPSILFIKLYIDVISSGSSLEVSRIWKSTSKVPLRQEKRKFLHPKFIQRNYVDHLTMYFVERLLPCFVVTSHAMF